MRRFVTQVGAIIGKELRVELRTREVLYTMLLFGGILVVIFAFGFHAQATARAAVPGVLWTAALFAGTVSLNRTFEREREGDCMAALTLVPGVASALFIGKLVANLLFLGALEALIAPLVFIIFRYGPVPDAPAVALALGLGLVGYATLGTLVGAMLGQVRMRSVLLPLVLFPLMVPVFGIGVTATSALLGGQPGALDYLGVLAALDAMLFLVSWWLFGKLMEGA